jgi:hypothetical protein
MRYLILLTLILISSNLYGQLLKRTPYELRMDSIGASNWHLGSDIMRYNDLVAIRPYKWVKVTIKAGFNRDLINDMYASLDDNEEYDTDNLSGEDYFNFGKYDIRLKVYITKRIRVVNRVLITGVNRSGYQYTSGIILKF